MIMIKLLTWNGNNNNDASYLSVATPTATTRNHSRPNNDNNAAPDAKRRIMSRRWQLAEQTLQTTGTRSQQQHRQLMQLNNIKY